MNIFDKSEWVWLADDTLVNSYVDFTADFVTEHIPEKAVLRVSCDGSYFVTHNDCFLSVCKFHGYEDMKFYREIPLDRLIIGKNTLQFTVHRPAVDFSTYRVCTAGLIFEVEADGVIVAASGKDTLAARNPNYESGRIESVSGQLGFTFHYDATAEPIPFTPAAIVNGKDKCIQPEPILPLAVLAPMKSVLVAHGGFLDPDTIEATENPDPDMMSSVASGKKNDTDSLTPARRMYASSLIHQPGIHVSLPGKLKLNSRGDGCFAIFDLQRESAGMLSLRMEVPFDCDVIVGWGEHLDDLRVRCAIGGRNFAVLYHAKAGENIFDAPLLRLGLRYLQIHVYAPECTLTYVGIRPTVYPLATPKECPMTDELHRRIYEVCADTLQLCMHEHYEDCPWREQSLYSMDSRNQMLCGYYVFGEQRFAAASLRLMAHSIREDNLLELCSPARVPITIPSFSAIYLTQLYEYCIHTGDTDTATELLPTAERIAKGFLERRSENGLLTCYGDRKYWNFYEWQTDLSGSIGAATSETRYDAPLCAFVSLGFGSMAKLCEKLGYTDKARYYREEQDKLNEAMQIFYQPERGIYASYLIDGKLTHDCELTNSLFVCCGAGKSHEQSIAEALKARKLIPVTLSHNIFVYDALLRDKSNTEWILDDIAKKWGSMLYSGATSFWETIEGSGSFGDAGSLCHAWSATPAWVYFQLS